MVCCDFLEDARPSAQSVGLRDKESKAYAVWEIESDTKVARVGLPVLERLAEDLGEVAISIVLTDADANVLGSFWGSKLGIESMTDFSCVEAPIEDPRRDGPVGTIRIACAIAEADPLMLAFAQLAARTISRVELTRLVLERATGVS